MNLKFFNNNYSLKIHKHSSIIDEIEFNLLNLFYINLSLIINFILNPADLRYVFRGKFMRLKHRSLEISLILTW